MTKPSLSQILKARAEFDEKAAYDLCDILEVTNNTEREMCVQHARWQHGELKWQSHLLVRAVEALEFYAEDQGKGCLEITGSIENVKAKWVYDAGKRAADFLAEIEKEMKEGK